MRNATAKRLRQIAKSLGLETETKYAPGGPLRRRPSYRDDKGELQPGAPIPRPFVLRECVRRAYREAKKIYKGQPMSLLAPEAEAEKAYQAKVVDSMRAYKDAT